MNDHKTAIAIMFAALIIFLIIVGPLITIWSLNTLFPVLAIPYTIWTWLATVCLFAATVRTNVSTIGKNNC